MNEKRKITLPELDQILKERDLFFQNDPLFNSTPFLKEEITFFEEPSSALFRQDLTETDFSSLRDSLTHMDFRRLQLSGSVFTNIDLTAAVFHNSDLSDCMFNGAVLKSAQFNNAKLLRTKFIDSKLNWCSFEKANLQAVSFRGSNLTKVNFTLHNLKGTNFSNAILFNTDFSSADLDSANFFGAKMEESKFTPLAESERNTNLKNANFEKADLKKVDLQKAKLEGANMKEVNLERADCREAAMWRVDLWGANLALANFNGATGLYDALFAGKNLSGTVLPTGIAKFEVKDSALRAAQYARKLFSLTGLFSLFTLLQLIFNKPDGPVHVQSLGLDVPPWFFQIACPAALVVLFGYFLYYMHNLFYCLGSLPKVFPNGEPLYNYPDPWLLIKFLVPHQTYEKKKTLWDGYVAAFLIFFLVPLTILGMLVILQARNSDYSLLIFYSFTFVGTVILAAWAYSKIVAAINQPSAMPGEG